MPVILVMPHRNIFKRSSETLAAEQSDSNDAEIITPTIRQTYTLYQHSASEDAYNFYSRDGE